jgi:hypothetical protein
MRTKSNPKPLARPRSRDKSPINVDMVHYRQTDEILLCRDAGGRANGELVAKVHGDLTFAYQAAAAALTKATGGGE